MKENWYALFICLNTNMSVDKALLAMKVVSRTKRIYKSKYSDEVIKNVFALKNSGKTVREITEIVKLTRNQVVGILQHKKAIQEPTKVTCIAHE